jgi:putative FmdB family regulatory protein
MPLYEYYCADCRGKFEMFTSYETSEGDIVCTKCHGGRVRKMFSLFASPHGSSGFDDASYDDGDMDGGCSCGGACSCGGH